jgi:hypothetical protein
LSPQFGSDATQRNRRRTKQNTPQLVNSSTHRFGPRRFSAAAGLAAA